MIHAPRGTITFDKLLTKRLSPEIITCVKHPRVFRKVGAILEKKEEELRDTILLLDSSKKCLDRSHETRRSPRVSASLLRHC